MTLEGLVLNAKSLQQGMQSGTLVRDVLLRHGEHIVEQQQSSMPLGNRPSAIPIQCNAILMHQTSI